MITGFKASEGHHFHYIYIYCLVNEAFPDYMFLDDTPACFRLLKSMS